MRQVIAGLALVVCACAGPAALRRTLEATEEKFNEHLGFVLYDPASRKTMIEYNSSRYFTPASNTKIFTFFTALQILHDSVPGLRYTITNDSLIFWGTGDPSLLYQEVYDNRRTYEFLRNAPQKLYFSSSNFRTDAFGPGWAWDDYPYPYSSERSPLPVYGNLLEVTEGPDHSRFTMPALFSNHLVAGDSADGRTDVIRDIGSNQIVFRPGKKRSGTSHWKIPFHYSSDLVVELLSDTLKRQVEEIDFPLPDSSLYLNSIPSDSLYRVMMQESDNFIAEHLLLLCAGVVSDTLKPEIAIRYSTKNLLFDLPDKPVWVDGSGLSRYNLFTPRSVVRLWEKLYTNIPRDRLFALLAATGQPGTLMNWKLDSDKPWIYGKTGSLSNNHSLSGYLLTKKGKILIFSFMNANFIAPTREIRIAMQDFLLTIRNKY